MLWIFVWEGWEELIKSFNWKVFHKHVLHVGKPNYPFCFRGVQQHESIASIFMIYPFLLPL